MSVTMIQDRLNGYNCRSSLEEEQSLREITQEIVPAALEAIYWHALHFRTA